MHCPFSPLPLCPFLTNSYHTTDSLNHASIIDGIRLCKAQRHRYNHLDMADLERILKETVGSARNRLIVTDGAFR